MTFPQRVEATPRRRMGSTRLRRGAYGAEPRLAGRFRRPAENPLAVCILSGKTPPSPFLCPSSDRAMRTALTKCRNSLYLLNMVKTRISSKGQTTVPRRFLKLWKTSQVLWDLNPDGTARVSPTPDIMALMGSIAEGGSRGHDEKGKVRAAIGRNAAQEGLSK